MVKSLPCNSGDVGSNPGQGTNIPHAVGLEPIIQNEVSQKEKAPIQYTNAYIWNLERW